ncbi:putative SOS response-associated peptidase YedK [Cryobacterium sp. MP_M3]|uniref:SOS response-associated peptidase n=1 Tax=unclassified Cryobacterium TaxID=2649013 RepID=UPI0018CB42DB|nr:MULTISPECIES: SOS response-associated peptidase [unclassified Cryobacterium]MBG6059133.1 putative SOS response-associated peptidase YedK [Cryobacterium sp. MP_M3]
MCGRFAMDKDTDDLIREFVASGGDFRDWRPSYNIAPTDLVPVVREWEHDHTVTREVDGATWGLAPAWAAGAKAAPAGSKTNARRPAPINARLETVATNGMFRAAFTSRRCIVPMTGYYEWEDLPDGKQPHFIHSDGVLAAAGLYAGRQEHDGTWSHSMAVITREARDASGDIHDRMPAFLTRDAWDEWLRPGKVADPGALLDLLDRSSLTVAGNIRSHPVSRRVNNARVPDEEKRDPELIAPVGL